MNAQIDWNAILKQLDIAHPPIQPNHYRYLYVGHREYIYDVNVDAWPSETEEPQQDSEIDSEIDYHALAQEMLAKLTPQEAQLVQWILYDGKSYAFCGRHYKCTRQNIRYLYKRALAKLHSFYNV